MPLSERQFNEPPAFCTTQWTQVLSARGKSPVARAALSDLCEAYYQPVHAFIARSRKGDDAAARELTQEFFSRLLTKNGIDGVDRDKGRFRSFLLGAVKNFLSDVQDHSKRLKRGGGEELLSLDVVGAHDSEGGIRLQDDRRAGPDREFDRKWALTILDRALGRLAEDQEEQGNAKAFGLLKPWLTGDSETVAQAEVARQIGMNEGAIKVAIHRLRKKFRALVKEEIGRTLNDPAMVADELACLMAALRC